MSQTPSKTSGLSYTTRKRLALLILIIGLPVYIVVATTLVGWLNRPGIAVEFGIYVGLGVLWAVPCRKIFRGIGQADPDAPDPEKERAE